AAAARKSAKKSRSGSPRLAAPFSPGTGNANESVVNTWPCFSVIVFVGPKKTEYASTHGMMQAMSTTHETDSNEFRKQNPSMVIAPSFAKFESASRPATLHTTATSASADAS